MEDTEEGDDDEDIVRTMRAMKMRRKMRRGKKADGGELRIHCRCCEATLFSGTMAATTLMSVP